MSIPSSGSNPGGDIALQASCSFSAAGGPCVGSKVHEPLSLLKIFALYACDDVSMTDPKNSRASPLGAIYTSVSRTLLYAVSLCLGGVFDG